MASPVYEGGAPDDLSEGELEDGEVLSSDEEEGEKEPVASESVSVLKTPDIGEISEQEEPNVERICSQNEGNEKASNPPLSPTKEDTTTNKDTENEAKELTSKEKEENLEDGEIFSDDEEAAYFPQLVKSRQKTSSNFASTGAISDHTNVEGGTVAANIQNTPPPRRKSRFDKDWKRSPSKEHASDYNYNSSTKRDNKTDSESDETDLFFEDRTGKSDSLDVDSYKRELKYNSPTSSTFKYGRREFGTRDKEDSNNKGSYNSGGGSGKRYSRRQTRLDQTTTPRGATGYGSTHSQFSSSSNSRGMTPQQFHSLSSKVVKRRERGFSLLPLPQGPKCHSLDQCNYPAPPSWYLDSVEQWEKKREKEQKEADKRSEGDHAPPDMNRTQGQDKDASVEKTSASQSESNQTTADTKLSQSGAIPSTSAPPAPPPPPSLMDLALPLPPIIGHTPLTCVLPAVEGSKQSAVLGELKVKVVGAGDNDSVEGDFNTEPVSMLTIVCEAEDDVGSTRESFDKSILSDDSNSYYSEEFHRKQVEQDKQDTLTPTTTPTTPAASVLTQLSFPPDSGLKAAPSSTQDHPQPMEVETVSTTAETPPPTKMHPSPSPSAAAAATAAAGSAAILNPFPRVIPESDDLPMEDFDYDDYLDQLDEEEDEKPQRKQGAPPLGSHGNKGGRQAKTLKSLLSDSLAPVEPMAIEPSNQALGFLTGTDNPLSEAFQCIKKESRQEVGGASSQPSLKALVDSDDEEGTGKKIIRRKGRATRSSARRRQKDAAWRAKRREGEEAAVAKRAEDDRLRALTPCKYHVSGLCKHGDSCQYSHDVPQERKKGLCKFYLHDSCSKGESCLYHHGSFPCKFYHISGSFCKQGQQCKFSHAPLTPETRELLLSVLDSPSDVGTVATTTESVAKRAAADALVISIPKFIATTTNDVVDDTLVVSIPHSSLGKSKSGSNTRLEVVSIQPPAPPPSHALGSVPIPFQSGMPPPPMQNQFNPYSMPPPPPILPPHAPNFQPPPVPLFPPKAAPPLQGGAMGEISSMPPPPLPPPPQHPPPHTGRKFLLPTPPPNMMLTRDDRQRIEGMNPEYWEAPNIHHLEQASLPPSSLSPPPNMARQEPLPPHHLPYQQPMEPSFPQPPPPHSSSLPPPSQFPPPPPLHPPHSHRPGFSQNRPPFPNQPPPPHATAVQQSSLTPGHHQQQQQQQNLPGVRATPTFLPPPPQGGGPVPVPVPPWDHRNLTPAAGMDPRQTHSGVRPPNVPAPNWGSHSQIPIPPSQPQHDQRYGMGMNPGASPPQMFHSNVSPPQANQPLPGNLYHSQQSPPSSSLEHSRGQPNFIPPQFGGSNIHPPPQQPQQHSTFSAPLGAPPSTVKIGPWGAAMGEKSPERHHEASSSHNSPRRADPRMKYGHLKIKSKTAQSQDQHNPPHPSSAHQQQQQQNQATSHSILKKKDSERSEESRGLDFYHSTSSSSMGGGSKVSNFKIPKLLQDPRSLDKPLDAQDLFGREREMEEGESGFGRSYGEIDPSGAGTTTGFGGFTSFYSRNDLEQPGDDNATSSGDNHNAAMLSYGEISLQNNNTETDTTKSLDNSERPKPNPDNPLLKLLEEDSSQDRPPTTEEQAATTATDTLPPPPSSSKAPIPSYLAAFGDLAGESDLKIDSAFGSLDKPPSSSSTAEASPEALGGHKEEAKKVPVQRLFGFGL